MDWRVCFAGNRFLGATPRFYRRELRYGALWRTIPLPAEVKSDETKATFRNGILEVRIPKAERGRPKNVQVEVQS